MIDFTRKIKRKLFAERIAVVTKKDKKKPGKVLAYFAKRFDCFHASMGWKWSIENLCVTYTLQPVLRVLEWIRISFQYSVFLWDNGYDWDYASLMNMLRFKLQRKYDFFVSEDTSIQEALEVAKEIKEVIDLIDAFQEDDFAKEENAAHKAKWGEIEMIFDKDVVRAKDGSVLGSRIRFNVPNATTKEEIEQHEIEENKLIKLECKRRQECWDAIWDKMKVAQGWWD
jgi:hypothetical protein